MSLVVRISVEHVVDSSVAGYQWNLESVRGSGQQRMLDGRERCK